MVQLKDIISEIKEANDEWDKLSEDEKLKSNAEESMLEQGRERDWARKKHPVTGDTTTKEAEKLLFDGVKK